MDGLLKRIKINATLSAALYTLLGLVLLIWPAPSTRLLCTALGLVLLLCAAVDVSIFALHRKDGTLYAGAHLIVGVILAALGIWLLMRPTLITVIIPRIMGALICVHGVSDFGDAITLRKNGSSHWAAAVGLGILTLVLGLVLVVSPFAAFTTVVRVIGGFLMCDGITDLWITRQVSRSVKQAISTTDKPIIDVDYRDAEEK